RLRQGAADAAARREGVKRSKRTPRSGHHRRAQPALRGELRPLLGEGNASKLFKLFTQPAPV
ncbi:unnamed protein product, partial [Ectocarpus fasciculatus]